jgi:hypothetical protein
MLRKTRNLAWVQTALGHRMTERNSATLPQRLSLK